MNGQQIIDLARNETYTDITQIPDVDGTINGKQTTGMLTYLNFAYRDLIAQITNQVNEDLYADIYTADLNAGQIEYSLPVGSSSQVGLQNILGVSINYTEAKTGTGTVSTTTGSNVIIGTNTIFTQDFQVPFGINININIGSSAYRIVKIVDDTHILVFPAVSSNNTNVAFEYHRQDWITAYPKRQSMLKKDIDYYIQNQPYDSPIFIAYDTGCFIYPQPKANILGGLKLYGTVDPIPLTVSSSPILDSTWHYVLAIAMKRFIFSAKGMANEKNDATNEYQMEFNKTIATSAERELMPVEKTSPPLTEFQ